MQPSCVAHDQFQVGLHGTELSLVGRVENVFQRAKDEGEWMS